MLGTDLAGMITHNNGIDITGLLGAEFTWILNTTLDPPRYIKTFRVPNLCDPPNEITLQFSAWCDVEADVWKLTISSDCLEEQGVAPITTSIPACEAGSEVNWVSVAVPNCFVNQTQSRPNLNCNNINADPVAGVTRIDIKLTYSGTA